MLKPKPCPFCGVDPKVFPTNPEVEGNAWGEVCCVNPQCSAQPHVRDGADVSDYRGSEAYKDEAIKRWNTRAVTECPCIDVTKFEMDCFKIWWKSNRYAHTDPKLIADSAYHAGWSRLFYQMQNLFKEKGEKQSEDRAVEGQTGCN